MQLWREVQTAGYRGTYKQVQKWAYHQRDDPAPSTPHRYRHALPARRRGGLASLDPPRRLVWLLLGTPQALTSAERRTLACIQHDRELAVAYELAQQFIAMVRQRQVAQLDTWLATSAASDVAELQTFAAGLRQDYGCVRAALTHGWSTGPVEGHINRVKMVKRQMFGRAKLDLLRQRVLHPI